jgi:thymidylate synthase (FAD)
MIKVNLLQYTDLSISDTAICKCYDNTPHSDLKKQQGRINRVANVSKHASTIEHLVYSFDISNISRALLQELSRHRLASYTVKSTRYTLKELKEEESFLIQEDITKDEFELILKRVSNYIVLTGNPNVDFSSIGSLETLRLVLLEGVPNDKAKYCMPEAYKTSLVMTINARSLQNFLELRSSSHALWEIQNLAQAMYDIIPEEHKFLYDYIFENKENNE